MDHLYINDVYNYNILKNMVTNLIENENGNKKKLEKNIQTVLNIDQLKLDTIEMFNEWLKTLKFGHLKNYSTILENIHQIEALSYDGVEWVDLPILDVYNYDLLKKVVDMVVSLIETEEGGNKQDFIQPGTINQYWRGDKTWQTLNTSAVIEGLNLYYTNERVKTYADTLYSPIIHSHNISDINGLSDELSDKFNTPSGTTSQYIRGDGSLASFPTVVSSWDDITNKPSWIGANKPTYSYNEITNTPTLFSGNYNDLSNKPSIPTKTSDLTNDSSFITSESDPTVPSHVKSITEQNITDWGNKLSDAPSDNKQYGRKDGSWVEIVAEGGGIITETDPTVPAWAKTENKPTYSYSEISNTPSLATVATSGSYNDLSNTPSIPSSKSDIGLGNVDNTADADKPVSTAQGLAIGAKYTKPELGIPKTDLEASVQTSLGKADSALQSFTETDPTIPSWAKAESKPSYTASEVGLGNVDNTSDANKPISTATQTALNNKQDTLTEGSGISIINNVISAVGGGVADSVDWSNVQNKPAVIGAGATQADARSAIGAGTSNFSGSYNDLSNTPTIPSIEGLATEEYVDDEIGALTLGDVNVQSDWNVVDNTSDAYIKNKPSIPSISGLATETYVDNKVKTDVPLNAVFTDTVTTINNKTGAIAKEDITALGIPSQDTTYSKATVLDDGLLSKEDFKKLDDIKLNSASGSTSKYISEKGTVENIPDISGLATSSELTTHTGDSTIHVTSQNKTDWSAKWDYNENTIKGVKVNNAGDADTVNGKTVAVSVPEGAIFTDTVYSHPNHTGDVTSTGDGATVIGNDKVTNEKLANMPATTIKGNNTGATADPKDLTPSEVRAILNVADGANNYSHPTSDGNLHVPATGTTNDGKVLKAGATAGSLAWETDNDTITTINGKTGTITKADIVALGIPAQDTVYTHPAGTNPHGTTKSDVGLGNVDNTSDADKPVSTAQQTAINSGVAEAKTYADGKSALAIPLTQKGANNGVAELDSGGKVLSSQLPSYVDDVLNYTTQSNFPVTGESGKIYIAEDTNKTYRWTGSAYVEISPSIALGETPSTAYRGDRGATAYNHSQSAHAPSNAQKNSDITKAEIEAKLTGNITSHTHTIAEADVQNSLGIKSNGNDGKVLSEKGNWVNLPSGFSGIELVLGNYKIAYNESLDSLDFFKIL